MPGGVKSIGFKWVFKTKKYSQGNIERHKERLVAKWVTKREGIYYTNTFSHVSKKDYHRTIMELVTHFYFELHRMDEKTTFLKEDLEE